MLIYRSSQAPIWGPEVAAGSPPWPNRLMFSGLADDSSDGIMSGVTLIVLLALTAGALAIFNYKAEHKRR